MAREKDSNAAKGRGSRQEDRLRRNDLLSLAINNTFPSVSTCQRCLCSSWSTLQAGIAYQLYFLLHTRNPEPKSRALFLFLSDFLTKQNVATYLAACMWKPGAITGSSCLGDAFLERPLCSPQILAALRYHIPWQRVGTWDLLGYLGPSHPGPWARFAAGPSAPTPPPTAAAASVGLEMRERRLSSQGEGAEER